MVVNALAFLAVAATVKAGFFDLNPSVYNNTMYTKTSKYKLAQINKDPKKNINDSVSQNNYLYSSVGMAVKASHHYHLANNGAFMPFVVGFLDSDLMENGVKGKVTGDSSMDVDNGSLNPVHKGYTIGFEYKPQSNIAVEVSYEFTQTGKTKEKVFLANLNLTM